MTPSVVPLDNLLVLYNHDGQSAHHYDINLYHVVLQLHQNSDAPLQLEDVKLDPNGDAPIVDKVEKEHDP